MFFEMNYQIFPQQAYSYGLALAFEKQIGIQIPLLLEIILNLHEFSQIKKSYFALVILHSELWTQYHLNNN